MRELTVADTCIVGAGPAGLALALRLAGHGHRVTLIDGGGPRSDANAPDLHAGEIRSAVDDPDRSDDTLVGGTLYPAAHLLQTRWRHPGGAAWRWGARGRPDDVPRVRMVEAGPSDFAPRPAFDIPGFPVAAEEFLRHRHDVLDFLGLGGQSFDPARYDDGRSGLDLSTGGFVDKLFHFPRTEVLRRRRPAEAVDHPAVDLQVGLHLVGLERRGDRITELRFVDAGGGEAVARPDRVVLALGGVETARQLLLARRDGVLDDRHDQLGRWFMDHPHLRLGYLDDVDPDALAYYDFQEIEATPVLRGHAIRPDVADRDAHLRFCLDLVGRHADDGTPTGFALASASDAVRRGHPARALRHLPTLAGHPARTLRLARYARGGRVHHTGFGGWSDPATRQLPVGTVSVESMFEQRPSPDNRIRLGSVPDRYGRPLPALQWSWSRIEIDAVRRAVRATADAFAEAGAGRLTTLQELGEGDVPRAGTGLHHLGGTRMHTDAEGGVVDADCRVHETENLYLASSSVFPTSVGFANPTFTLLELSMRLADHLAGVAVRT